MGDEKKYQMHNFFYNIFTIVEIVNEKQKQKQKWLIHEEKVLLFIIYRKLTESMKKFVKRVKVYNIMKSNDLPQKPWGTPIKAAPPSH